MKSTVLFGVVALALGWSAWGQSDEPEKAVLDWKTKSSVRVAAPLDGDNSSIDTNGKVPEASQEVQLKLTKGDLKVALSGTEVWEATAAGPKTTLRPKDNYLSWAPGNLRFDAGWQTFHWGSADDINPTDILNSRDYTAGFDGEKIPVLALTAFWYPSDTITWEGEFIPVSGVDKLATEPSAALPDSWFSSGVRQTSNRGFSGPGGGTTWATRLRQTWDGTTLALSGAYGYDTLPTPVVHVNAAGLSAVDFEYERLVKVGADVKTIVDRFGAWLETGAQWTPGTSGSWDGRHPAVSWTTGFDVNYGEGDRLYTNVQYFGRWSPGFNTSFSRDYPGGQPTSADLTDVSRLTTYFQRLLVNRVGGVNEGLVHGLSIDFKVPSEDESVTWDLKGIALKPLLYDETPGSRWGAVYLTPEVRFKPIDSLLVTTGVHWALSWIDVPGRGLQVNRDDAVGQFTAFNQLFVAVQYEWAGSVSP